MKNGTASAGAGVARRSRPAGRRRFAAFVALGAAAAIALAACGGSSSSSSSKKTTTTKKSTTGAAASAVVKTAQSSLGTIVVDSSGKTVYTLTNNGQQVPCTGMCLSVWPAVLLPAGTTTATGSGVKGVGSTMTAAGQQVTINGAPVYTFMGDAQPGSTAGEGINSFGGTWHVVMAGGGSGGSSTSTTAKSGGSSGY
jgi:predicted lipoprotein with Yx(FWY)xxD motif